MQQRNLEVAYLKSVILSGKACHGQVCDEYVVLMGRLSGLFNSKVWSETREGWEVYWYAACR